MTEKELKHRIRNAIIIIESGNTFKVGDLTFGNKDKNTLTVAGWTLKNSLKNLTKKAALSELNEIKTLFKKMTEISSELSDFISNREVEFVLGYNYGMGDVGVCSEIKGKINWESGIK